MFHFPSSCQAFLRPPVHGAERTRADALNDVARTQDAVGGFLELRVLVEVVVDAVRAEERREADLAERLARTVLLEPDDFVLRTAVRTLARRKSIHGLFERELHEKPVRALDEQDVAREIAAPVRRPAAQDLCDGLACVFHSLVSFHK